MSKLSRAALGDQEELMLLVKYLQRLDTGLGILTI
jgi:hypothetical protein